MNYKENFINNTKVIMNLFKGIRLEELIFPIVVGYSFTCLVYNFAILQFAWNDNIMIPKNYFDNLLLGEFFPLFALGVIYSRVFAVNYLSLKYEKVIDILIYSVLCFSSGYFYASLKLNLSHNQEMFGLFYILFLFIINITLSVAKENNVKQLLKVFCIKEKATFFKGQI